MGDGAESPTVKAERIASAAASAASSLRAWTMARGRPWADGGAEGGDLGQADRRVDRVLDAGAAAAQRHDGDAERAGIDGGDGAGSGGVDFAHDGSGAR